jgi:hypothetical protein
MRRAVAPDVIGPERVDRDQNHPIGRKLSPTVTAMNRQQDDKQTEYERMA